MGVPDSGNFDSFDAEISEAVFFSPKAFDFFGNTVVNK